MVFFEAGCVLHLFVEWEVNNMFVTVWIGELLLPEKKERLEEKLTPHSLNRRHNSSIHMTILSFCNVQTNILMTTDTKNQHMDIRSRFFLFGVASFWPFRA